MKLRRGKLAARRGDSGNVLPSPALSFQPRRIGYRWASLLCATLFVLFIHGKLLAFEPTGAHYQAVAQKVAQKVAPPRKLPSAEKIVDSYLKTIGGKKRVAAVRDATYEWTIQLKDQTMGLATSQTKIPSSMRLEMRFGNGQVISAANSRSAWTQGLDGKLHTLTDAEAAAARLQATLDAGHLLNFKKSNVLARVVGVKAVEDGNAFEVEFSLRSGARLRYLFSVGNQAARAH